MKSPDDVKKGLECCAASYADCHKECPYKPDCDGSQILKDALTLIQQLQAENAEKDVRIQQLEAQVPRWISVEERLPEGEVLAANFAPGTYGYKEYLLGYVHKHDDLYYAENSFEILNTVTHWMPLPSTEGIK